MIQLFSQLLFQKLTARYAAGTRHHALGHAAAVGGRILLFLPLHDALHTIGKGDLLFFQIFERFQPDGGGQDEQQPQRDEEQQEDDTEPCHPPFVGCTIAPCAQNKQRDGAEDAQAHTRRHLPMHGPHRAEICVCLVKRDGAAGFRHPLFLRQRGRSIGLFQLIF